MEGALETGRACRDRDGSLGPGNLPEVGSAVGKSVREFRKALPDTRDAFETEVASSSAPAPVVTAPPVAVAPPAIIVRQSGSETRV